LCLLWGLPEGADTKRKICIDVGKNTGVFSDKSRQALLDLFERILEDIYSGIRLVATDMDTDVVALFYDREQIPLGYFYQEKYHL